MSIFSVFMFRWSPDLSCMKLNRQSRVVAKATELCLSFKFLATAREWNNYGRADQAPTFKNET